MGPAGGDVEGREVGVVPGHRDGPTLRVDCLRGVTGSARVEVESGNVRCEVWGLPAVQDNVVYSFIDWRQCDVVIQKLTELHQHQGVARVQIGHISMNYNGD